MAGVPFDTRPIPLDEVQLRVVFWEEDAVVAPRNDELLDGVLLILEVRLLREDVLEAAGLAVQYASMLRHLHAFSNPDAFLGLCILSLLLVRRAALGLQSRSPVIDTTFEEDLLEALRVPNEPDVNGALVAGLRWSSYGRHVDIGQNMIPYISSRFRLANLDRVLPFVP